MTPPPSTQGANPFGTFDLVGVAIFHGEGVDLVPATDEGFVTIGDAVAISIEGPNAPAIAAFIVCACNAHGDLITALKGIIELASCRAAMMERSPNPDVRMMGVSYRQSVDDARAALSKSGA